LTGPQSKSSYFQLHSRLLKSKSKTKILRETLNRIRRDVSAWSNNWRMSTRVKYCSVLKPADPLSQDTQCRYEYWPIKHTSLYFVPVLSVFISFPELWVKTVQLAPFHNLCLTRTAPILTWILYLHCDEGLIPVTYRDADGRESIPGKFRNLILLHCVLTCYGAPSTSYPVGYLGLWPGRVLGHSSSSAIEIQAERSSAYAHELSRGDCVVQILIIS
jgi:hypothetical protein